MQACVTHIDYQKCANKIRHIKHKLELGALLDSLHQHGVIDCLLLDKITDIHTLSVELSLPEGYLGISFKCLWINGFFHEKSSFKNITLNEYGSIYLKCHDLYHGMQQSIEQALKQYHTIITDSFNADCSLSNLYQCQQSAPFVLVYLFMLSKIPIRELPQQLQKNKAIWQRLIKQLLPDANNINTLQKKDFVKLQSLAQIGFHTLSYLPSYTNILKTLQLHIQKSNSIDELHVDRRLDININASIFQAEIAKIFFQHIKPLFDHPLFAMQPQSIVDLGCGNGEMLEKIYQFIVKHTLRGKVLEDYPLHLIGVDCNSIPIQATQKRLSQLNTPHAVIYGDIDAPKKIWEQLNQIGLEYNTCLHICKSVIHDAAYHPQNNKTHTQCHTETQPFYVYADDKLDLYNHAHITQSLQAHFTHWQNYIGKYGYLIIEAHNGINDNFCPQLLSSSDKSNLTTLNLSHDLSLQYLVDSSTVEQALCDAGFNLVSTVPLQKVAGNTCLALYYIQNLKREE